jgi:hypothetical protein
MPRRRDPGSPPVVHRTARAGLRLTRAQRRRLLALLIAAGDVWACVLELNAWRRARQDRPLSSYQELCRLLAASGPGTFGELDSTGARSVLRHYADAWHAAAKRRRAGDRAARFPRRRRRLVPLRWYHGMFDLEGRLLRLPVARGSPRCASPPDPAAEPRQPSWFQLTSRTAELERTFLVCPQRDVTRAAALITAAPAGPLAGTGPLRPPFPRTAGESLALRRGPRK